MRRLAVLCRVSTEGQKEDQTIEVQKAIAAEWAAREGWAIVEWYLDDGWSGGLLARPELDRMRRDATADLWDAVFCCDRDRIARKLSLQELVIDELTERRKQVIIHNDPLAETTEGRIMQQIKGVFAEYERAKITERLRLAKLYRAKDGKVVGHEAAFGYRHVPRDKHQGREARFEVYEPEAEVVRLVFRWVADDGYSIYRVIRELHAGGIMPPEGRRATWSKSSVGRLLKRRDYVGEMFYNRTVTVVPRSPRVVGTYKKIRKSSRRLKPEAEWVSLATPGIIDAALFDRAQARLRENAKYSPRNRKHDYLLSGKVYCACGSKRVGDKAGAHHYYRCAQRVYKYPLPARCEFASGVNADALDGAVWDKVVELMADPRLVREQYERWAAERPAEPDADPERARRAAEAERRLGEEERRYAKAYGEGLMGLDVYRESMAGVRARRLSLQKAAAAPAAEVDRAAHPAILDRIVGGVHEALRSAEPAEKVAIVRKLVEKVTVGELGIATIEGRLPIPDPTDNNIPYGPIPREGGGAMGSYFPFRVKIVLPPPCKARVITARNERGQIQKSRAPSKKTRRLE